MNPANGSIGLPPGRMPSGVSMPPGTFQATPGPGVGGQRAIGVTPPPTAMGGMGYMPGYAQSLRGAPVGAGAPAMGAPASAPFRGPGPPGGGGPGPIPAAGPATAAGRGGGAGGAAFPGSGSTGPGADILALLTKGAPPQQQQQQLPPSGALGGHASQQGGLLAHLQQQQLVFDPRGGGGAAAAPLRPPGFPASSSGAPPDDGSTGGGGPSTSERLLAALHLANTTGGPSGLSSLLSAHALGVGGGGGAASGAALLPKPAGGGSLLGLGGGSAPPVGVASLGGGSAAGHDAAAASSPEGLGLLGLLSVIRMSERDLSTLALGSDLTSLGLNLNSAEPLHPTFDFPWGDVPASREPQFALPACYKMPQPALKTGHLQRFDAQTLFYIFYSMPRDVLQAYAAQELHAREWRYHTDNKLWFRRETEAGKPASSAAGGAVQWVYWDVGAWEKRVFTGAAATLAGGFLAEDEARVRVP